MIIRKETNIEDLVNALPASVKYLEERGIKCIDCGEPIWGTIEEAAREKGFEKTDIDVFVKDLKKLMDQFDK